MQPVSPFPYRKDAAAEILRAPPHSLEAEQAVLGGLMLDNATWDQVADCLDESDFYRNDHRLIFRAVRRLAENSKPFDLLTLAEWLENNKQLEDAGGFAYLGVLARDTPSAANVRAYADIIRERAIRRELIRTATEIADSAYDPKGRDSRELLDDAEKRVFAIAERGSRTQQGFANIKDLLARTVERIDILFQRDNPITGVPTGWADFDEKTAGLQRGDLIVIAGRPSMGKTSLAMNIVEYAAIQVKCPVAVFKRHWTRVKVRQARSRLHPSRLLIESQGKSCEVGVFLTEDERRRVALQLTSLIGGMNAAPALAQGSMVS